MVKRNIPWLTKCPYAHRGLHGSAVAENSLAALHWALDQGVASEIDVRVLSDESVVLFHDDDCARMTGVCGAIEERSLDEIAHLRLRGSAEKIPTLADALDVVAGRAPLLIDLKSVGDPIRSVEIVCQQLQGYSGEFAIISRNQSHLAWLREHSPNIVRGQVFDFDDYPQPSSLVGLGRLIYRATRLSRPHFVAFDLNSLSSLRAWLIKAVVPLIVWTVTNSGQWRWAEIHASNFMFELSSQMLLNKVEGRLAPVLRNDYEPDSVIGRIKPGSPGSGMAQKVADDH